MLNNPIYLLFMATINFATWVIFIRFLFEWAKIDKKHPYAVATYRLSAVVTVFQKILPNIGRGNTVIKGNRIQKHKNISTAAIVLMFLLFFIKTWGIAYMSGSNIIPIKLFFFAMINAIISFLTALKWTIIVSVVASFVVLIMQRVPPIVEILMQIADPIIAPFRKISPNLGMIDLAPLIAYMAYGVMASVIGVVAQEILIKV